MSDGNGSISVRKTVRDSYVPRHRPLLSAAVAFAVGIAVANYLSLELWCPLVVSGWCAACLVGLRRRLGAGLRSALVLLLVGAVGAATMAIHTGTARSRARSSLAGLLKKNRTLCAIRGTVSGEAVIARTSPLIETHKSEYQKSSTFRVQSDSVESNGNVIPTSGDVKVTVTGEVTGVAHGDRVCVLGWIVPINPDDPSARYAASKGFVARMFAASPDAVKVERRSPGSPLRFLYAIKQSFRGQIDAYFSTVSGEVTETGVVLKAVLLGDRGGLGRRLEGIFNKSGTTHLLAISGLHVGIVYAAAIWLCRMLLVQRWPRRVVVLSVVLAYAVMIGLRPATIRAALMIVLFELGGALKYYRDPINAVAASALIILAAAPHHLFEAGFQLTFIAVLGIILFAARLTRLAQPGRDELDRLVEPEFQSRSRTAARRIGKTALAAVCVCAAATLVVAPLQAYYFNIVTPVSILATALLVPIVGALIWFGFAFLALASFVPLLAGATVKVVGLIVSLFVAVVNLASVVPFGHVFVAPPPPGWVWLFYGAVLLVAARRWFGLSRARAVLAPACVLCAYLAWRALVCPGPELAATFVDVRHGTCAVITRGRQTIVYDCGSGTPFSTYDVGRGPAAQHLWRVGIKRIDLLILSHTDTDHVNGVLSLMDRFPVGRIVANKSFTDDEIGRGLARVFERRGIPFAEAGAGDRIELAGIDIEVLWPPKEQARWRLSAVNDRSLVARIRSDGRSLLLTGDVEQAGMGGLLATRRDLRAEVLYVPHHGAEDPVLAEFVAAVRPDVAVISAGDGDEAEQERVKKLLTGAQLYNTLRVGNIYLRSTRDGWVARTGK